MGVDTGGRADAVDVAVVKVLQAGGEPFFFPVAEHELQEAGEVVQVLAGVEQVDDLGGFRYLKLPADRLLRPAAARGPLASA